MIKTNIHVFDQNKWNEIKKSAEFDTKKAQLVFVFGSKDLISKYEIYEPILNTFSNSQKIICTTSGEIFQSNVKDDTIVISALQFDKTNIKAISTTIDNHQNNSKLAGKYLFENLNNEELAGIIVISDGINVNGGELVEGLNENNIKKIPITGGLAGDGSNFSSTLTGLNSIPTEKIIISIGLYGKDIKIGHGSLGGWNEFGHEKTITKSEKNVLYELDNKGALDLYKEYLGAYAEELPASALLFPISLKTDKDENIVRTILTIDEKNQSMTFAGNMPEGSKVRLMKANFDKLIEASSIAAQTSATISNVNKPDFALLISCVGRKLVLQDRTEEEVESAVEILGKDCSISGFYSYGEISPLNKNTKCELHNQTMTITTLSEI